MRSKSLFFVAFAMNLSACQKNTYPCPDIHGGTEVLKAGSTEGLKKPDPEMDANGRLTKKPYAHAGMRKRRRG